MIETAIAGDVDLPATTCRANNFYRPSTLSEAEAMALRSSVVGFMVVNDWKHCRSSVCNK